MKRVNEITRVRNKTKNEEAITLVALAVTIIVLLILAGVAISLSVGNNGIISRGEVSVEGNKLASYKEKLEMYKAEKIMENENFLAETLSAGTDYLQYNTKKAEEKGTIKTIIPEFEDKYLGKLEIIKGELFLTSTDKKEVQAAKIAGIEFNPYDITEEGELQSSNTNLELMSPDGTLTIPSNVSKIGYGAFSNVEGLKTIIIPGTCKIIGEKAFANNQTLEKVIIQDGVEIIEESAFRTCYNLISVEMADTVVEIGKMGFYNDTKLKEINLSTALKSIGQNAFQSTAIQEIKIPEGMTSIASETFLACKYLQKIVLPSTINEINSSAFGACSELTQIDINNNNFNFKEGILMDTNRGKIIAILKNAIKGNTLTIPEGIKELANSQISGYSQVTTVNIPKSVEKIDVRFFTNEVVQVNIDEKNNYYEAYNDGVYRKSKGIRQTLIKYYGTETNVIIEEGIKSIEYFAFRFRNITSIKLPESLEIIGPEAFSGINIKSLYLGKNIKELQPKFLFGAQIDEVLISNENPYYIVENDVIYSKDTQNAKKEMLFLTKSNGSIKEFKVEEGVTKIGKFVFGNQYNMEKVILPKTLNEIDSNAFAGCNKLTRIEIPTNVNKIGENCFSYCMNLNEIIVNKAKGEIEGSPWGADKGERAVIWLK